MGSMGVYKMLVAPNTHTSVSKEQLAGYCIKQMLTHYVDNLLTTSSEEDRRNLDNTMKMSRNKKKNEE